MKTTHPRLSRRNFILAAAAGTAAGAAAVVAQKDSASGAGKDSSPESKKGYQLTEHVRNYYRTAKI